MGVLSTLPWFVLLAVAEAGYYKVRPPPPPPPPPGSIHYGPHPPSGRYPRPPSSHYPHPPQPHYPSSHRYPPPPRYPHPGSSLVKAGSVRHYTRYPPPIGIPQKPVYSPYAWKNGYNAFRAPTIKESFAASPPQPPAITPAPYTPTFLREDDDKGPIHTIPAPNLGPQDKPASLFHLDDFSHQKKPLHSTEDDLAAVLQHGVTKVNVHHNSGYQVTEDPSLHQPSSGSPSFFAPDPSPDIPNVKLPPTTDPHSLPSNGQVPLDLYLQQEAEKNHAHHNEAVDSSNQLTAQDLFNLLNYNPGNPVGLIPQAHLQQHVLQPNVQFYNPGLLLPQNQQLDASAGQSLLAHQSVGQNLITPQAAAHTFNPQFQTFNYEEQTQQGAYGSDSFPASSMNLDVAAKHLPPSINSETNLNLEDNDVEGSERHESYNKVEENEIPQQQPETQSRKQPQAKEISLSVKNYAPDRYAENVQSVNKFSVSMTNSYSTKTASPQVSSEKQNFESNHDNNPQSIQNEGSRGHDSISQSQSLMKPGENVQLQKSIQIYENTYAGNDDLIKQEIKNLNEYADDYTDEEKIVKEMAIGQPIQTNDEKNNDNVHLSDDVPFGARIRPKRF